MSPKVMRHTIVRVAMRYYAVRHLISFDSLEIESNLSALDKKKA